MLPLLLACAARDAASDGSTDAATDTATDTPVDTGGALVEGGVVTCADPDARDTLGPMTDASLGPDWDAHMPAGWEGPYYYGESLAVADITGDDRYDVLVADGSALLVYASTPDGSWREESAARIPDLAEEDGQSYLATVAAADVDGDADLDLLLGRYPYGDALLLNSGDGTFTDVTATAGLATSARRVRSTPFGDIDGDGDLDLFVGTDHQDQLPPDPGDPNALYENLGGGVFRDVTERMNGEGVYGYTRVAGLWDLDGDGALDLYIANHMPVYETNRFLRGDGAGGLTPAPEAGLDLFMDGMGLGVADINGDAIPDLVVSGWGEFKLLESLGDGTWADTALARGLVPDTANDQVVAWGSDFADFDNDGRLDVVAVFGEATEEVQTGAENPANQPDGLWLQEPDETFTPVAEEWGVADRGMGRAVAAVDVDGDGWVDLVRQGKKEAPTFDLARCGEASWLTVRLRGAAPNTFAVGAVVEVYAGELALVRPVGAMSSALQTSLPQEVHVGLGDYDTVDRLVVRWPDGRRSEWRDVEGRQIVTAWEGEGSGR